MKNFLILLFFINSFQVFGNELIKYEGKSLNISNKILVLPNKNINEMDVIKGLYDHKFRTHDTGKVIDFEYLGSPYYIKIIVQNLSSEHSLNLYGWFSDKVLESTNISIIYLTLLTINSFSKCAKCVFT